MIKTVREYNRKKRTLDNLQKELSCFEEKLTKGKRRRVPVEDGIFRVIPPEIVGISRSYAKMWRAFKDTIIDDDGDICVWQTSRHDLANWIRNTEKQFSGKKTSRIKIEAKLN